MTLVSDLALLQHQAERRRDPLRYWKCSSWAQTLIIREVVYGTSVYAHAGNRAGKTEVGCALDLAFTQGRPFLLDDDGQPIEIPILDPPVIWALGVKSYKLGGAASIQTLRHLLGESDFREEHAGAPDNVSLFRIRHARARTDNQWSRLYVFPYDGPDPEGPGLDGWHCDEPPPRTFLQALRFRKRAGRMMRSVITATPLNRLPANGVPGWATLLPQYPEELAKRVEGRMRIQWSLLDNDALSQDEKLHLKAEAEREGKIGLARLHGEHVNAAGDNPWPRVDWDAWLAECHDPLRVERITVQGEQDAASERVLVDVSCDLETFEAPVAGDLYYCVGDPAKGIRDGIHNPDGIQVWSRRRKKLVARVNEYLGEWALAEVMAILHKRYNEALCDPLQTGGYGGATLSRLRQLGVRKIASAFTEESRGQQPRLGSVETVKFRERGLGYVEEALMTRSATIPSEKVVRCLMACVIDSAGKIVAGPGDRPGDHGEDLSCMVAAMRHIQNRRPDAAPAYVKPEPTGQEQFAAALEQQFGRPVLGNAKVGDPIWKDLIE